MSTMATTNSTVSTTNSPSNDSHLVIERYLPLPITQLKLCARIWNTGMTNEFVSPPSTATASSTSLSALSLPTPLEQDTHFVMIHGWLDNAASWDRVCAHLIQAYPTSPLAQAKNAAAAASGAASSSPSKLVCYAIEMSGHGNSDHRSIGAYYHPIEHAIDMIQAIRLLQIPDKFYLMGHSLGGAVSYLMSTALGNRLNGLCLMDNIGPWSPPIWGPEIKDPTIHRLANVLQEHLIANHKRLNKAYEDREQLIQRYVKSNPFMEVASARTLAERAIKEVLVNKRTKEQVDLSAAGTSNLLPSSEWRRGFVFKHDTRLRATSLVVPIDENTRASFRQVTCPVLVFLATNRRRKQIYAQHGRQVGSAAHWMLQETTPNYAETVQTLLKQFPNEAQLKYIDGDHHIHMDSTADEISQDILTWMTRASELQRIAKIVPMPNSIFLHVPSSPLIPSKL